MRTYTIALLGLPLLLSACGSRATTDQSPPFEEGAILPNSEDWVLNDAGVLVPADGDTLRPGTNRPVRPNGDDDDDDDADDDDVADDDVNPADDDDVLVPDDDAEPNANPPDDDADDDDPPVEPPPVEPSVDPPLEPEPASEPEPNTAPQPTATTPVAPPTTTPSVPTSNPPSNPTTMPTGTVRPPVTPVPTSTPTTPPTMPTTPPPDPSEEPEPDPPPDPSEEPTTNPPPDPSTPPGPPVVPEECEPFQSSSTNWCNLEMYCPDDEYLYSYCSLQSASIWACDCSSNNAYHSYQLTGVAGLNACNYSLDLCRDNVEPEFDGPRECDLAYPPYFESNYCEMAMLCSQSADLGDGVTAVLTDSEYASCSLDNLGNAACNCSTPESSTRFSLPGTSISEDTCSSALNLCSEVATAEPEGPITCGNSYQSASQTWCNAEIECVQFAPVGDLSVGLYGTISTSCEPAGAGAWTCYCSTPNEYVSFNLESSTGWDACTLASATCPDLVDVQIGNTNGSGGGIGFPTPIPVDGFAGSSGF